MRRMAPKVPPAIAMRMNGQSRVARERNHAADPDRVEARHHACAAETLNDVVTPPHLGKEVAAAIPGAKYQLIADTGHLGFLERPETVNAAILKFFKSMGF